MEAERRMHVYTGDGKGKTTAAMGLALRCLGHGGQVLVAQFLKDGRSGELAALADLPGATIWKGAPVSKFTFQMTPEERAQTGAEQTEQALQLIAEIARIEPQMVILDELGEAAHLGLVEAGAARSLIDAALAAAETVVTGRDVPDWMLARASYVSRIAAERHPYRTEGLRARRGVEW